MSLDNKNIIKFYRASGKYGFLSNLYKHPIIMNGIEYKTSEHAYQSFKFKDPEVRNWAIQCPKPHIIACLAHNLLVWDIVENWTRIKVDRMYEVLKIKFYDPELKQKLIDTRDSILFENSKSDSFWGGGKKGTGKNMLGKLLMKVRRELKEGKN